jgi:hypothetical protein
MFNYTKEHVVAFRQRAVGDVLCSIDWLVSTCCFGFYFTGQRIYGVSLGKAAIGRDGMARYRVSVWTLMGVIHVLFAHERIRVEFEV